jgi:ATP-dependent Clp protease ATP-binding subunit ClpC
MMEVEKHFRPEFLNRLDEVIVFESLDKNDLKEIIDIELRNVQDRLKEQGFEISLDEKVREFLIEQGYNPEFGARPLRRAVEQNIEDALAEELLRGAFEGCDVINITLQGGRLVFDTGTSKAEETPETGKAEASEEDKPETPQESVSTASEDDDGS